MNENISIELRNETNTRSFTAVDGGPELLCSLTNHFVQLRNIPWKQMQSMVYEFANTLDQELTKLLLQPATEVRKGSGSNNATKPIKIINQNSPEALSINLVNVGTKKVKHHQIAGKYCSTAALALAVESCGLTAKLKNENGGNITPAWKIVYEPFETQRMVANAMLSSGIRNMDWTVPSSELRMAASERVVELMKNCENSEDFLSEICSPLLHWFRDPIRKGANGAITGGIRRPLAIAWFAIWMSERGLLLFPLNEIVGRGSDLLPLRYRHFLNGWIRPVEHQGQSDAQANLLYPLLSKSIRLRDRASLLLLAINLAAPGIAFGRVSAECLKHIRGSLDVYADETSIITSVWKVEEARLKALKFDPAKLQSLSDLVIQNRSHVIDSRSELWSWVDNSDPKSVPKGKYRKQGCTPGPNLKSHVFQLRSYFPAYAGKSARRVSATLSIWLYFLSSLKDEDVPKNVIDITPRIISTINKDDSKTLRAFMELEKINEDTQRKVFSQLKKVWSIANAQSGNEGLLCPVSDQMLSLAKRGSEKRPSNSTRRAIDMEILDLLIDENRANDFQFSRDRCNPHSKEFLDYRFVTDAETGLGNKEWWPGPAVLMDLLLQIPIRHKQGRFLDSGEGDEFSLDIASLRITPNSLSSAVSGCNQAFIQRISLSPLRDEPGLGMFINTNKTGRDYTFPWLPLDIAENVQRVIDWQRKYNPIYAPVSDREDTREERAAAIEPIWVFPIFRDPGRSDHTPLSSGIVLDYFRALLKHVEKKYNLQNKTTISFFRPNGEPVYDIHSLRVTGVTRLLSMGVDPRIVRLLVGHSSLTMTWYYEHITNQRVAAAMQQAFELRRPTREMLMNFSHEEKEQFLERLFNRSDLPKLSITLLRGMIDERSPLLDVMVDGFCPGMRCADAGVWRDRACSLCKFFATGPAFLAGLELKLNNLMAELILQQTVLTDQRQQLFIKRKKGDSIRSLQAEITSREQSIDHVLSEWEAQFQYVKKAEGDLFSWLKDNPGREGIEAPGNSNLMSPTANKISLVLQETHHLHLFTGLVEGAKHVEGFVPMFGARESRDAMLLEIARHENKTDLFFRLKPAIRKRALDQFALLLLDQELPNDEIEALISGTSSLSAISSAKEWLEKLAVADITNLHAIGVDANE